MKKGKSATKLKLVYESEDGEPGASGSSLEKRRLLRKPLPGFIGAFLCTEAGSLVPVQLFDISTEGLSFDCEHPKQFKAFDQVALRIYVSRENYFHVQVKIANSRIVKSGKSGDLRRYGVRFEHTGDSIVLYHFVRFLEILSHLMDKKDSRFAA